MRNIHLDAFQKPYVRNTIVVILVLIVFPVVYLNILDATINHKEPQFVPGFECNDFTNGWHLATSIPIKAEIFNENGTLRVTAKENLPQNTIVTAQKLDDFVVDVTTYPYLRVSIRTSSIETAARIVVWPNSTKIEPKEVLVKTYDDNDWHTEVVDLSNIFALSDDIIGIELGFRRIASSTIEESVFFKQLSFNLLEVQK